MKRMRILNGGRAWDRLGTALLAVFCVAMPVASPASSHREAPGISEDPTVDDTDPYVFVSPEDPTKVILVGNWIPGEEPSAGPNYYRFADAARYRINIDIDGQLPVDDIVYEFAFQTEVKSPDATFLAATGPIASLDDDHYNLRQYFTVTKIVNGVAAAPIDKDVTGHRLLSPPNNIGPFSTPSYAQLAAQAVYDIGNGVRVFAGQRDDPFFVDLGAVFDGLQLRPVTGTLHMDNPARLGQPGGGRDALAGFNVHSIVLEVPISQLVTTQQPILGMYTSASRPTMTVLNADGTTATSNEFVQVSRLGFPLANELFDSIPTLKDQYNLAEPGSDFDVNTLQPRLRNPELTGLFRALFPEAFTTINLPPQDRRDDLVSAVLTGVPGLNRIGDHPAPADLLRLNTSLGAATKPSDPPCPQASGPCYSRLGVIGGDTTGFPNGRRPWDDIVDVELRVAAGVLYKALIDPQGPDFNVAPNNLLADGVDVNDQPFLTTFPFIGVPSAGKDTVHAGPVQGNAEVPTVSPAPNATSTPTVASTSTPKPTATPSVAPTNTSQPTAVSGADEGGSCNLTPGRRTGGGLTLLFPVALTWLLRRRSR